MTDWIANAESGSSVRGKLNAVLNNGSSENKTTGASPVIADNTKSVTRITTGGTAGNEDIYLPQFAATDTDGYTHVQHNGMVKSFVVDVQTDGSDVVRVYQSNAAGNSTEETDVNDAAGNNIATAPFAVLDYQGATVSFVWWDYNWFLINTEQNNSTEYSSQLSYVDPNAVPSFPSAHPVDGGEAVWVVSGGVNKKVTVQQLLSKGDVTYNGPLQHYASNGATSGDVGSDVDITGGAGNGAANGGNSRIGGGNSGDGATGNGGSMEVHGGHALSTDGSGGDLILYGGDKTGSGVQGHIRITGLQSFADDAAAATGGVPVNGLYRTASAVKIRVS